MTKGANKKGVPSSRVERLGEMAAPTLRATAVTPAAEDRSSGAATAITYDCRVGTSIWLMLNRNSSIRMARGRVGMNGTRISSTLEGRCVKTIVLISPIRDASHDADRALMAARMLAPKK